MAYDGARAMTEFDEDLSSLLAEAVAAVEGLCARALDAARRRFAPEGRVDAALIEAGQTSAHALAWLATYAEALRQRHYDETNIWGNIYNGQDLEQPREYMSYAGLPWVKTICELGFAGGHSTVVYRTANHQARIYSFDDFAKPDLAQTALKLVQDQFPSSTSTSPMDSDGRTVPRISGKCCNAYYEAV